MKNILLWQAYTIIFTIFRNTWFSENVIFSKKTSPSPLFRECVSVTRNGHFFPKNVGKISPKNSENYVLLWENTFCKKWQSGRINFFWGGFSAFMVYALTLISDGHFDLRALFGYSPNKPRRSKCSHTISIKKINIIYIGI